MESISAVVEQSSVALQGIAVMSKVNGVTTPFAGR
jgi:hypothetical protein